MVVKTNGGRRLYINPRFFCSVCLAKKNFSRQLTNLTVYSGYMVSYRTHSIAKLTDGPFLHPRDHRGAKLKWDFPSDVTASTGVAYPRRTPATGSYFTRLCAHLGCGLNPPLRYPPPLYKHGTSDGEAVNKSKTID